MSKARDIADLDFNSPDIDGGNIDGAVIGANTPAAGSFTTGSFSGNVSASGTVYSQYFGSASDTNTLIQFAGSDDIRFRAGGSEKLRVNTSGINVTGSVTASGTLQADRITANGAGSSNYAVYGLQNSSMTHAGYFQANGNDIAIEAIATGGTYSSDVLYVRQSSLSTGGNLARFANSTGDKVVITTAGNVGIGGSPAFSTLEVIGDKTESNNLQLTLKGASNTNKQMIMGFDTTANTAHITTQIAGASPTPLHFKTAEAIFTVNGSEAMRISGDNVLVGTTSDSTYDDTSGTSAHLSGSASFPHTLLRQTASTGSSVLLLNDTGAGGVMQEFRLDGASIGSIGVSGGRLYIGSDDTSIFFDSGATPSLRPHGPADPDGVIDIGESGGYRFKDLYLSGGIFLGGTGSANKLDDYEEGTWTPAYTTTNSDATVAYQTQRGRYVKIGDFVSITWYVEFGTVTSAGSGSVKISGVPFQAQGNNDSRGSDTYYNVDYDSSNYLPPISYLPSSGTSALQFLQTRNANSWSVASTSTMTISTNDIISGSMVFRAA